MGDSVFECVSVRIGNGACAFRHFFCCRTKPFGKRLCGLWVAIKVDDLLDHFLLLDDHLLLGDKLSDDHILLNDHILVDFFSGVLPWHCSRSLASRSVRCQINVIRLEETTCSSNTRNPQPCPERTAWTGSRALCVGEGPQSNAGRFKPHVKGAQGCCWRSSRN